MKGEKKTLSKLFFQENDSLLKQLIVFFTTCATVVCAKQQQKITIINLVTNGFTIFLWETQCEKSKIFLLVEFYVNSILFYFQMTAQILHVLVMDFAWRVHVYAVKVGEVRLAPLLIKRPGNAFPIVRVTAILTSKLKSVFVEANGPEMIVPKVNYFRFQELIWHM